MAKIPTFQERVRDGLWLRHEGSGIYHILTSTGILRTKHVRDEEFKFPGFRTLGQEYGSENEEDDDSTAGNQHLKAESSDDDGDKKSFHEISLLDKVTYVPAQPSVFGETITEGSTNHNESLVEKVNADGEQPVDGQDISRPSSQYNLRQRSRIDYTFVAQTDMMNSSDELKVSTAFNSHDKHKWIVAIHEEFETLQHNKTWTNGGIPPQGARILPSEIILKIKRDPMGKPARFKARLVARGKFQADPIDYTELYAPVACIEMVRILLSVAVAKSWSIDQLDVKGAFCTPPWRSQRISGCAYRRLMVCHLRLVRLLVLRSLSTVYARHRSFDTNTSAMSCPNLATVDPSQATVCLLLTGRVDQDI